VDALVQRKVLKARAYLADPVGDIAGNGQGVLTGTWFFGRELAGIQAHRGQWGEARETLRVTAAAGTALFECIAAEGPIELDVWPRLVTMGPHEPCSLASVEEWTQVLGLLALSGDSERIDRLARIGTQAVASSPIRYQPHRVPLADAWLRVVAGLEAEDALERTRGAGELAPDQSIYDQKDRPHLDAMLALQTRDAKAFDGAMAAFFDGHRERYQERTYDPTHLLAPVGLGLLALARRAGLACSVTSDFAPNLLLPPREAG